MLHFHPFSDFQWPYSKSFSNQNSLCIPCLHNPSHKLSITWKQRVIRSADVNEIMYYESVQLDGSVSQILHLRVRSQRNLLHLTVDLHFQNILTYLISLY
jgi:hypothetical protein